MPFTKDEMKKIAVTIGTLQNVGGFLSKTMPKFFEGAKGFGKSIGLTAANANKVGVISGVAGGIGGVASGASDPNEQTRGRSMVTRGVLGATAGFFGGKALAQKMPTLGDKYSATGKLVGTKMLNLAKGKNLSNEARSTKLTNILHKNIGAQTQEMGASQTTKNFFGHGGTVASNVRVKNPDVPMGFKMVGDLASARVNVNKHGLVGGLGKTLKTNFTDAQYFNKATSKNPGAPVYRYKRSLAGRVVNPLVVSGVGMGATDLLPSTNEDGTKATIGKRLRTSAKSTLTWGVAPHLMMGKAMTYDIPKTFMGGNN